MQIMVL